MNIKKIIQEEINDFGWVNDINPTLFEYFENGLLEVGDVVTVRGETLDTDGVPVFLDEGKYLITHLDDFGPSNFNKFIRSKVVFDNETQQKLDIYKETSLIEEDKGLEVLDHQRGGTMDMGDNILREDDGDGLDWIRGIEGPKGEELREILIGWLSRPFGRDSAEKQINGSTVYYTATSIDRDSYLSNLYKIVYSNGTTEIVEIDDELNVFSIPWFTEKRITNDENIEWILVLSPQINESDDLDWIRELKPKRIEPCVKRGKCKEYVITGLEDLSNDKVLEVLGIINDLGWDTRDFEDWWDYEELCYFYLERRGNCNWDDCELVYHEEYNYEEITPQDILNVVPQEKGLWGRYIDKLNESDDLDWVREVEPKFNVDDTRDYYGWWKYSGKNLITKLGLYDFEAEISSSDYDGYVRVESNYGYFYHHTSGINETKSCPENIYIESVVWGKRKRIRLDISDCKRDPWHIFNEHIKENAEGPASSIQTFSYAPQPWTSGGNVNESDDFDWVKEAKPTFGFFIDQFFRVGGYRAFMEALKDYFGIGETVLLTGDLYLAGGTENSVIKLNQEPFRIMDVNQGKIRVKPIKLSKEHSDMWDSWIGEPYIDLGDTKEDREIIIERPDNPILEQDDFDWIRDINPVTADDFINKAFYFDPIAEEGDEDYSRLVDKLNDLGFSPAYGTVSFVGEGEYIAGLFSYLDFDRNPKYVFTHDDFDTRTWDDYEQHIQGYALGESEARDDLEVVDARAFVTQFT